MIAVAAMLIDHVGAIFFPQYIALRIIGRVAFPIFAYTLVEGFIYTKNVYKYMWRLGVLAFISEIPFDLAFYGTPVELSHQNVFFTLFLGILLLFFMLKINYKIFRYLVVLALLLISEYLHTDYNSMGLLMVLIFYFWRENRMVKSVGIAIVNIFLMGYIQVYAVLALIPIALHNREQGPKMKWFFYGFYPVHLFVLYSISMLLMRG